MYKYIKNLLTFTFIIGLLFSCDESYLDEVPLDQFSPENVLESEAGYDAVVAGIYDEARREHLIASSNFEYMTVGTDLARWGRYDSRGLKDYTLLNSNYGAAAVYWDWAYEDIIVRANLVLDDIDNVSFDAAARDNIKGQALFFRGFIYNFLINIYGGVPIVDSRLTEPKFDFTRSSRLEVLNFIVNDLEEAVQLLPIEVEDGRVSRAAAYHLISEVYISLGMETGDNSYYTSAVNAASMIIDGQVGSYALITSRFGPASSQPGDVFSDLHAEGQSNTSEGNTEAIFVFQYESFVIGGGPGNNWPRYWAPEYDKIQSPAGFSNSPSDSTLRGIGVNSPTNYVKYDIWALDWNDMRNSKHNIRRMFYYNNPNDTEYFGKPIRTGHDTDGKLYILDNDSVMTTIELDTLRRYYPWIRKLDGRALEGNVNLGRSSKDIMRFRLAETYLLRAEAHFRNGNLAAAADDINVVRDRANAVVIAPGDVTEDFILDERARELLIEEPRVRTLIRMNRLVDRVRTYNSSPDTDNNIASGLTIQDHNKLWPIPQKVIDANTQAVFEQNPGYAGSE